MSIWTKLFGKPPEPSQPTETESTAKVLLNKFDENTNNWLKLVYTFLVSHVKENGDKPTFYEDLGPRVLGMGYYSDTNAQQALIGALKSIADVDISAGRPPLALMVVSDSSGTCMPDHSLVKYVESRGVRCSGVSAYEQMSKIARYWKNREPEFS